MPEIYKEAIGMKKFSPLYQPSIRSQDIHPPVARPAGVSRKYQVDMADSRIRIDRQFCRIAILVQGYFLYR